MAKAKRSASASASPPKKKPIRFTFTAQPSSSARPVSHFAPPFTTTPSSSSTSRNDKSTMPPPPVPARATSKRSEGKMPMTHNEGETMLGERLDSRHCIWAEKYAPEDRASLAVHKRKIESVESWLSDALYGTPQARKYRRLLVLRGPSGAGKTAALRILAQPEELDFDIVEWSEGSNVGDWKGVEGNVWRGDSLVQRFSDFVLSACHYSPLSLDGDSVSVDSSPSLSTSTSSSRKHVLLLEDLPNISHYATREAFHAALRTAIAVRPGPSGAADVAPIVLILSTSTPRADEDDGMADGSGSSVAGNWATRKDNTMDSRTVLPSDVRSHPAYTEISFNPIAVTFLKKGLKRVLEGEFPPVTKSSRAKNNGVKGKEVDSSGVSSQSLHRPPQEAIDILVADSNGDIRSAINCLQFLACMDLEDEEESAVVAERAAVATGTKRRLNGQPKKDTGKGRKGQKGDARRRRSLRKKLANMSQRESSLALFHALGKLLFNKRHGDNGDTDSENEGSDEDESENLKRVEMAQILFGFNDKDVDWGALPPHLAHLQRRLSKVDINAIYTTSPVDPSTLTLYVHHNYAPFCLEVEQSAVILGALSYADAEIATRDESWLHSALISHLQFQFTMRSVLLALPSPAQRRPSPSATHRAGPEGFRKPAFFEVQTRSREMREGVEEAAAWFRRGGRRSTAFSAGLDDPIGIHQGEPAVQASSMGMSLRGDQLVEALGWIGELEKARKAKGLDRQFPAYFGDLARLKDAQMVDGEALGETELGEGDDDGDEVVRLGVWGVEEEEEAEEKGWVSEDDLGEFDE